MAELIYRKCQVGHLSVIEVQDVQKYEQATLISPEYAEMACRNEAFSMWYGNKCLGAAGVIQVFPHRAMAWALLSRHIGPHMRPATKKVRQFLALSPIPRIEMTVRADFEQGHRWAQLLGMKLETPEPLRMYGANGEDEMLYARVK